MTAIPGREIKYNGKSYPIVCMCGSTRFKDAFIYWAKWLTEQGCIVVMPMIFGHSGDKITEEQKQMLDDLHKAKILISGAIFVVNVDKYIGESTKSEIEFAKEHRKIIIYLEDMGEELAE